jgi:hypothetical protein
MLKNDIDKQRQEKIQSEETTELIKASMIPLKQNNSM